jgi:hypothetical protein
MRNILLVFCMIFFDVAVSLPAIMPKASQVQQKKIHALNMATRGTEKTLPGFRARFHKHNNAK